MSGKLPEANLQSLVTILSLMTDEELQTILKFHDYHRDQILIQMKVRREEKK